MYCRWDSVYLYFSKVSQSDLYFCNLRVWNGIKVEVVVPRSDKRRKITRREFRVRPCSVIIFNPMYRHMVDVSLALLLALLSTLVLIPCLSQRCFLTSRSVSSLFTGFTSLSQPTNLRIIITFTATLSLK